MFIEWIINNLAVSIPVVTATVGALFAGLWTLITFVQKISSDGEQKAFERYRLLSKELTTGRDDKEAPFIAFQLDAVYELRFYRKYYPRSIWVLKDLKRRWSNSGSYSEFHLAEVDETLKYISRRRSIISAFYMKLFSFLYLFNRTDN